MAHESLTSLEAPTPSPLSPTVTKPTLSRVHGKLAQGLSIVDFDLDDEGNHGYSVPSGSTYVYH